MRAAHPTASVDVWAEDEHRLGLLPVTRRVWARRGQRPIAWVQRRYQWLYVHGFVCPETGATWWALVPTVHTQAMRTVLAAFAREMEIDATHRVVLVLDGAGWSSGDAGGRKTRSIPSGTTSSRLRCQPAERLWPLVNEPVANRTFADLDELEAVLVERCQTLRTEPQAIAALTTYGWWPSGMAPSKPN